MGQLADIYVLVEVAFNFYQNTRVTLQKYLDILLKIILLFYDLTRWH